MKKIESRLVLVVSIGLYGACLTQNGVCTLHGCGSALAILRYGWKNTLDLANVGFFSAIPWLANPVILIAWVLVTLARYRSALICSATALLMAVAFLFAGKLTVESGIHDVVKSYSSGYWLWVLSMVSTTISSILGGLRLRSD